MPNKFHGSFNELKNIVKSTGVWGEWQSDGSKQTFRSHEGGILNWWQSSGTVQFQGKAKGKLILERSLVRLLFGKTNKGKPTRMSANSGLVFFAENRSEITSPASRYLVDDATLKLINETLLATGKTIIQINDSLCVVRKTPRVMEEDTYSNYESSREFMHKSNYDMADDEDMDLDDDDDDIDLEK